MKRLASLFVAALLAFAPVAQADLRASSGGFGPINATSGSVSTSVTGLPTLLAQSWVAVTAPADTSEDTLATITVPAGVMGSNGLVRLRCLISFTNNANLKTFRARYSGGAGTAYFQRNLSTEVSAVIDVLVANRNATNSQVGTSVYVQQSGAGVGPTVNTGAVDTTAATTILLTVTKATAGDTFTLEGYVAEVIH